MNQNILSKLVDVIDDLNKKQQACRIAFNTDNLSFLEDTIIKVENLILEELDVPEDNTIEMLKKYGEPEGYLQEETFCRDFIGDWFFDFGEGNMTKEKLIFNLLNWNAKLEALNQGND